MTCPKLISMAELRKLQRVQEHLLALDRRLNGLNSNRIDKPIIASARSELGKALCLVDEVIE